MTIDRVFLKRLHSIDVHILELLVHSKVRIKKVNNKNYNTGNLKSANFKKCLI